MDFQTTTTNIKLSVDFSSFPKVLKIIKATLKKSQSRSNFFVRKRSFTYVIFSNGHANVTGISDYTRLPVMLKELKTLLKVEGGRHLRYTIDNVCSAGTTPKKLIQLSLLASAIRKHLKEWCMFSDFIIKVDYQPYKFPSLHLKTCVGSILIFGSGKFILVGYKRPLDAVYLVKVLKHALGYRESEDHCHIT